jgi:hypothetical protein
VLEYVLGSHAGKTACSAERNCKITQKMIPKCRMELKIQTSHRHYKKKQREPAESPCKPKAPTRMTQARKKDDRGPKKSPKEAQRPSRKHKKYGQHKKDKQVETLFLKTDNRSLTCMELSILVAKRAHMQIKRRH